MASSAQPTRLSKLSFPRYTTSLATTPHVRPNLAPSHTPRGTRARTFLSTVSYGLVSCLPRRGEVCRASARPRRLHLGLLATVHSSAQGPLSAPNWSAHRARNFLCVALSDTPLPRNGAMRPRLLSSAPRGDPHRTRHGDSQRATQDSPDGEHAALCSTPRGTTIQGHPSARESAATCRQVSAGGKSRRATGTAPKRERRDIILSKGVWKSIRGDTGQLKETGRRGRTV